MRFTKVSFLILLIALVSFSCRKKIERDVQKLDNVGALHCLSGFLDGDELGIDCGGSCTPCVQPEAPCQLNNDEIDVLGGFSVQTKTFDSGKTSTIDSLTGEYTFKAFTDGTDYLEFIFESKPDISRTYKDADIGLFDEILSVIYSSNSSADLYMGGELYVNYENGSYVFSSCDADFTTFNGSSISTPQFFKVTFN